MPVRWVGGAKAIADARNATARRDRIIIVVAVVCGCTLAGWSWLVGRSVVSFLCSLSLPRSPSEKAVVEDMVRLPRKQVVHALSRRATSSHIRVVFATMVQNRCDDDNNNKKSESSNKPKRERKKERKKDKERVKEGRNIQTNGQSRQHDKLKGKQKRETISIDQQKQKNPTPKQPLVNNEGSCSPPAHCRCGSQWL